MWWVCIRVCVCTVYARPKVFLRLVCPYSSARCVCVHGHRLWSCTEHRVTLVVCPNSSAKCSRVHGHHWSCMEHRVTLVVCPYSSAKCARVHGHHWWAAWNTELPSLCARIAQLSVRACTATIGGEHGTQRYPRFDLVDPEPSITCPFAIRVRLARKSSNSNS